MRQRLYDMSMMPLDRFLAHLDERVIGRVPGLGVWLTKVEHGASPMLLRHLEHNRVFHERVALLSFVPDRRPRVPFHERYTVENVGHGFYRVQIRLGFMQTPDIPLSLRNLELLGFDADLERKHYYLAHETVVRREKDSAMGPVSFAVFSFLEQNIEPRAGFFQDSRMTASSRSASAWRFEAARAFQNASAPISRWRGACLRLQRALVDLADAGARQRFDEGDVFGPFVFDEVLLEIIEQLVGAKSHAGLEHDEGLHRLAREGVRHADGGGFEMRGV